MADARPARLDAAFARIEDAILPSLAAMIESLVDAAAGIGETEPLRLSDALRSTAGELEALTDSIARGRWPTMPHGRRTAAA